MKLLRNCNWIFVILLFSCNAEPQEWGPWNTKVKIVQTNGNKSKLLFEESKEFKSAASSSDYEIYVDNSSTFQTMYGFGAALTGSSAWLIYNHPERDTIMKDLFDPIHGAGINYIRITLGASDFSRSWYTYDDAGPDLTGFSIAKEKEYLIPLILEALSINPSLKIMGSPWSAPGWMKSGSTHGEKNLAGGYLNPAYYNMYAEYLYKTIDAFANEGITLHAVTLQNEPLHDSAEYPCMYMSSQDQADLVKKLGPKLTGSPYEDVKILVYDHNWDEPGYPKEVLNRLNILEKKYVAGSAWHAYDGSPEAMTTAHNNNPDMDVFFTEITGGKWSTGFSGNLRWNFDNIIIGGTRNWAQTALLWNLALDENGEPHIRPASSNDSDTMRGVLTLRSSRVTKEVEYYILAQVASYIQPGSIRINSNEIIEGGETVLRTAAFLNPDGSHALIVLNNTRRGRDITFNVNFRDKAMEHSLPDESVAVFIW